MSRGASNLRREGRRSTGLCAEATEEQVVAYLRKQDKTNITPAVADACAAVVDRIDYMGSTEPYGA